MYTSENFKNDLLLNIKYDQRFPKELFDKLAHSEFIFEDSSNFNNRKWNTFTRNLKIFCRTDDKEILDSYNILLYEYCDTLHGVKDNYMLMKLTIFINSSLDEAVITTDEIVINRKIIINKSADYIGSGGFSNVYKWYDGSIDMQYAFKVFDPSPFQGSNSEIMRKRFTREAKKLLSYSHENIVHAYDFGFLGDDSAYIKLEYIVGKKIIEYIQESFLEEFDKIRLMNQYISAMAYIHQKSDQHRDISYSNVMINDEGNIKVLDFGFVRNDDDTPYDTLAEDILHKFNPPDVIYDIRTEMYCIGAILFTIVLGQEFHFSKLNLLSQTNFDQKCIEVITKCLQTNPKDRFQNAVELEDYIKSKPEPNDMRSEKDTPIIDENVYSLDSFKYIVDSINYIEFEIGNLPTLSVIKDWFEATLPENISRHRFLSEMNIIQLLKQISGVKDISTYKRTNYSINKEIFVHMNDAYNAFSETERIYLIKGVHTIIYAKSIEGGLPFDL